MLQVRGQNGFLLSCMDPLAEVSGKQEVIETAEHMLETFYPVSPTIDLQKVHVYKENLNCTGEKPAVTTGCAVSAIYYILYFTFLFVFHYIYIFVVVIVIVCFLFIYSFLFYFF